MTKAHMTKAYWYDAELVKLLDIGYDGRDAHQMIMDRLATMDSIEWYEPTKLTVLSDNREAPR
jgi:hypothetical protein